MAGWNAITGARGIAAAFLMSALLQLGLVDVRTGLLLCAATSGVGVLLFVRAGRPGVAPVSVVEGSTKAAKPVGAIAPTG
jgi:hypothetical protein